MGLVFTPIGGALCFMSGASGWWILIGGVACGVAAGVTVAAISLGITRGAGAGILSFVWPSGHTTPYDRDFSSGLALEAGDDIEGAFAWFAAARESSPEDPRACVASADLHMRHGQHLEAEALYLDARRLGASRDIELYCTQRVIDLRLGPLGDPRRAFPELRRLIDRFPASREAEGARAALRRIKPEVLEEG